MTVHKLQFFSFFFYWKSSIVLPISPFGNSFKDVKIDCHWHSANFTYNFFLDLHFNYLQSLTGNQ